MSCACIAIYRKYRLDQSYREILKMYKVFVNEGASWFLIEPKWHVFTSYTRFELEQLKQIFGHSPEQEIQIFGDCDRITIKLLWLNSLKECSVIASF